jgi:hypothetical protein
LNQPEPQNQIAATPNSVTVQFELKLLRRAELPMKVEEVLLANGVII